MIPFKNRFHGHNSLRYVYKNGNAIRSRLFTIKATYNKHRKESRVAVVISKKVLKSAVKRNKVRRRLYELIRYQLPNLNGVYDIVVIISSGEILSIEHVDLSNQLLQLFRQAEILKSVSDISKDE